MNTELIAKWDWIAVKGPQGSGKGTQTKILQDILSERKVACMAMSDVLRHYINTDPTYASMITTMQSRGELINDGTIIERLRMYVEENHGDKHLVITDGFPRTPAQAFGLWGIAQHHFKRRANIALIVLDLDPKTALERCVSRAEKAVSEGARPREDDRPDLIERRLDKYFSNLPSIISACGTFAHVIHIDASKQPDEVHDSIMARLRD